jgi:hypothetical protein
VALIGDVGGRRSERYERAATYRPGSLRGNWVGPLGALLRSPRRTFFWRDLEGGRRPQSLVLGPVDCSRKPIIIEESTPSGTRATLYVRVGNATKALNLKEALDLLQRALGSVILDRGAGVDHQPRRMHSETRR